MASELVASIGPFDLCPEREQGNEMSVQLVSAAGEFTQSATPAGDYRGVGLPGYKTATNLVAYGYTTMFRIPANLTLSTGLTFRVYLTDDGNNAADLGKVVVLGLTVKRLAANATDDVDVSAATEVTANATLSSTSSGVSITSIAIANASLPASTAVGDLLLMRIRRIATNASDTCPGRPILLRVEVQNT